MQSGMANAALPTYLKSTRKQSKITAERARKHNSVHVLPGKQLVKNSESPRAMALGKQLWKNYLQTESSLYGRQAKTGPEVNQHQRRASKGERISEFERHRPFELPPVSMLGKNTPYQVRRSEKKKAAPHNNFKNTGKVSSPRQLWDNYRGDFQNDCGTTVNQEEYTWYTKQERYDNLFRPAAGQGSGKDDVPSKMYRAAGADSTWYGSWDLSQPRYGVFAYDIFENPYYYQQGV